MYINLLPWEWIDQKLADHQCSSITKGSIYYIKHHVHTSFYHGDILHEDRPAEDITDANIGLESSVARTSAPEHVCKAKHIIKAHKDEFKTCSRDPYPRVLPIKCGSGTLMFENCMFFISFYLSSCSGNLGIWYMYWSCSLIFDLCAILVLFSLQFSWQEGMENQKIIQNNSPSYKMGLLVSVQWRTYLAKTCSSVVVKTFKSLKYL